MNVWAGSGEKPMAPAVPTVFSEFVRWAVLLWTTNVPLEVAHLVENLDAIAQAVAYVDQAVVPDNHAVHGAQKYTANPCVRLCLRGLTPPLAEVVAFAIEDHDALVPVTIGNVHVAVARIDRDLRRFEQRRVARIQALAGGGAVGAVHDSLGPYLQQHFAAIVRILLNNSVVVARSPKVAILVDEATVCGLSH